MKQEAALKYSRLIGASGSTCTVFGFRGQGLRSWDRSRGEGQGVWCVVRGAWYRWRQTPADGREEGTDMSIRSQQSGVPGLFSAPQLMDLYLKTHMAT
jgi:hypothetical protein